MQLFVQLASSLVHGCALIKVSALYLVEPLAPDCPATNAVKRYLTADTSVPVYAASTAQDLTYGALSVVAKIQMQL